MSLELVLDRLPLLPSALELAPAFQPGGLKANRRHFEPLLAWTGAPAEALSALLFDPQTSGGLLLAVPEAAAAAVLEELPQARAIGRFLPAGPRALVAG